jgi:hypothetical protein
MNMKMSDPLGYGATVTVEPDPARHSVMCLAGYGAGYTPAVVDATPAEIEDGRIPPVLGLALRRSSNAALVGRGQAIELARKLGLPFAE